MGRTRKPAADSTAATVRKPNRPPWLIILAERDAKGDWHTTGEPLPNFAFDTEPDAYAYSMKRNRSFNRAFDWADDPSVAWVTVRADALGRLRSHTPVGEPPPERLPVGEEPKTGLAPPRKRGRPAKRDEDEDEDEDGNGDGDQDQDEDHDGEDGTEDDEDGRQDAENEAGQMMLALG